MADRTVTDTAGRTWTCASPLASAAETMAGLGRDVVLSCATPSVLAPVAVTVGWNWATMASNGLARLICQVSPAPR